MPIDMNKPLAPGRVRCLCCRRSMQRLKNSSPESQMHYTCLGAHVSGFCDDLEHRTLYKIFWRKPK